MKKIIISGPILSRSGYGEMARLAYRAVKTKKDIYDIYLFSTNWGQTGNIVGSEEDEEIHEILFKTHQYMVSKNNQPDFDISIQVTIPNEWKKIAKYNVGYTAGIETNFISPAWLQPSREMDKIIVISEHSKNGFETTTFNDKDKNLHKIGTPVSVCHFPVRNFDDCNLGLELKYDFNFLSVCQWGPRKNLEQTIINFIEEFKNEEVGLVLKTNIVNDSLIDREAVEKNLNLLLNNHKERKCSIHLLHGSLTDKEMNSLYCHPKIKALVSSTHGEGFGIPIFEAAYNELPIIATDWSGHLDFLSIKDEQGKDKKMFAKVDYDLLPIQKEHVWPGLLEEGTLWAFPLQHSLRNKMREVYKDYPRFKSWSKKLNSFIREKFTEEKIYEKFVFCLEKDTEENVVIL